ncbi:MAG TPA: relaxase/mobilization nuclease domain-containing protein, partial [Caulobacteraceae bacterium]|nr:relaxase/mobilization nuclease domain-containing protein [Caulobacteraceae bacterium]
MWAHCAKPSSATSLIGTRAVTDFETVPGFEDVWRPPVRSRLVGTAPILSPRPTGDEIRARLARIVNRAPEVMVKITGRTRDAEHLLAHLNYISRKGQLALEGPDGQLVFGRQEVAELAEGWAIAAAADSRRRGNSPMSLSIVLSMPAGTNEVALRDAARAFADTTFGDRHDYALTLHTDTPRPHVHLSVCSRGCNGERLNPKKTDLAAWRDAFARALRDRGVEAEATPRRARGITRRAERLPLRKMR